MKSKPARASMMVASVLAAALFGARSVAQEVLPAPPAPFKGQIGLSAKDSKPDFPQPVHAPEGAIKSRSKGRKASAADD